MSAKPAPKTKRLDLSPRPLIKGQDRMIINLLKTKDQAIHAIKLARTTLRVQPRQQPCPQNISTDGQAANNAAHIQTIHTTSVDLKTMQTHLRLTLTLVRLLRRRTSEPIKIRPKNEVARQSYQHVPIKMLRNLFRKTVPQHHQLYSPSQARVIYVRPRGILLRTAPKNSQ